MFKKIRNLKKIAIISISIFLIFIVGSVTFIIVSQVRINKTIDNINNNLNTYFNQNNNLND